MPYEHATREGRVEKDLHRCILHMDGDAFFVGCEVAKNPKLRGLPVVTGEERGIVSALSYEAKALGVTRGLPIFQLRKLYPQVLVLPGDYATYARYSEQMFDVVRRYADDVEEYSIDECFAELTGLDRTLYISYREIAERIKKEIRTELDLSVSIGLAPTKVLAKVGSKWKKPDGLTLIEREHISEFLRETSIGKIWGIGPKTSQYLRGKGIETALDFVQKSEEWVSEHLARPYQVLWTELRGKSLMHVHPEPKHDYHSIQKTRTFHPSTNDKVFLLSQLSRHIENACTKARHYGLVPRAFSFFLKTKEFRYISYACTLPTPTNAPEVLISLVHDFFYKVYRSEFVFRTAGVTLHDLAPESVIQNDLFGGDKTARKFEIIHKRIDDLEEKYGRGVVYLGSSQKALHRKVLGTDPDDVERDLLFL